MIIILLKHPSIYLYAHTHTALSNIIGRFITSQYRPTSVRISWETVKEGGNTVTGYRVQVEGPDPTQEIPVTCKYITSVEISDLRPSTHYTFKVSAVTVKGTTGESSLSLYTCVIITATNGHA